MIIIFYLNVILPSFDLKVNILAYSVHYCPCGGDTPAQSKLVKQFKKLQI